MSLSTEARVLERTQLAVGVFFALTYFAARSVNATAGLPPAGRALVSLAPLPMFLLYIYVSSRAIGAMDEMRRLIELRALAFAFPASLALLMTLGLLERADVLYLQYRHVWLIVPFFYYFGVWIAKRRYR